MYEAAEVFGLIPGQEHCEMHDMLKAKILKGATPEARVFYTSQGKSSLSDPLSDIYPHLDWVLQI